VLLRIHTHTHIRARRHTHTHTHTCSQIHTHELTNIHKRACKYTCARTPMNTCTHTHTCGHTQAHIGPYTYNSQNTRKYTHTPLHKNACCMFMKTYAAQAKPIRTASGIAVVAVMSKPHRCPHIATTGAHLAQELRATCTCYAYVIMCADRALHSAEERATRQGVLFCRQLL